MLELEILNDEGYANSHWILFHNYLGKMYPEEYKDSSESSRNVLIDRGLAIFNATCPEFNILFETEIGYVNYMLKFC